jgi:hypothetical protein
MQTTDTRLSRLQTAQTALQLIGFEQDREDRQAAQAAQEKAAAEQTASAFRTETYTFEAVRPETAPAASQTSEKVAPASSTAKSPRGFPVGTQGEIRPSLLLALVQIGCPKSSGVRSRTLPPSSQNSSSPVCSSRTPPAAAASGCPTGRVSSTGAQSTVRAARPHPGASPCPPYRFPAPLALPRPRGPAAHEKIP